MNDFIVIGDIHNKTEKVELFLEKYEKNNPSSLIVFTGDYFDDFQDNPSIAASTANWLKESLSKVNRIHLMGNHDFSYYPFSKQVKGYAYCPGFTLEKDKQINQILSKSDWQQIKFAHQEENYWISHAGFTEYWFRNAMDPEIYELGFSTVNVFLNTVFFMFEKSGTYPSALLATDRMRGGRSTKGGLLWNDWFNLDPLTNINQIVGHTPGKRVQIKRNKAKNSINYNVDCFLTEFLEVKQNSVNIIKYTDY